MRTSALGLDVHRVNLSIADRVPGSESTFERPVHHGQFHAPFIDKSRLIRDAAARSFGMTGGFDRSSEVPLYQQVAQHLLRAIESGEFAPGTPLDSEIELAARLGVSRSTMRRAIGELVTYGTLIRKRGAGTQVVRGPSIRPMQLTHLFDDPADPGRELSTAVLVNDVVPAPVTAAKRLNIPARQRVLHLRRVRFIDGVPAAILENYLPIELLDLHAADFTRIGLYQAMRASGIHPKVAKERIGARIATAEECALLHEPPYAALLTLDRVTHADTGWPIEWGHHVLRPSKFSYTVTSVAP